MGSLRLLRTLLRPSAVYDVSTLIQNSISGGTSLAATDGRENTTLNNADKPIRNPYVVLREEFDDWAILFNPDTGRGFGLSPTGVQVWKLLDGQHPVEGLVERLRERAENVPEDVRDHIVAFVDELVGEGLAGFDATVSGVFKDEAKAALRLEKYASSSKVLSEGTTLTYEPPRLVHLTDSGHATAAGTCGLGYGNQSPQCGAGLRIFAAPTAQPPVVQRMETEIDEYVWGLSR